MKGITLDAGALIALERRNPRIRALLATAHDHGLSVAVPTGVIAQVWRGGAGSQVPIARLLNDPWIEKVPLDEPLARAAGVRCGSTGHSDIVDASVVLCALERGHHIVTSDPHDIGLLAPTAALITI